LPRPMKCTLSIELPHVEPAMVAGTGYGQ